MESVLSSRIRTILWGWGPVLGMMALLFVASAQPKYEPPGGSDTVYFSGVVPVFPDGWDFLIKKSSHVLVYGLFAVLTQRALLLHGWAVQRAAVMAVLLVVGYALTDEFHQSFTPGRRASFLDIGFDTLGALVAVLLVGYLLARRQQPEWE